MCARYAREMRKDAGVFVQTHIHCTGDPGKSGVLVVAGAVVAEIYVAPGYVRVFEGQTSVLTWDL